MSSKIVIKKNPGARSGYNIYYMAQGEAQEIGTINKADVEEMVAYYKKHGNEVVVKEDNE